MDKADIFAFGEEVMAEGNLSKKTIEGMRTSLRLLRQYTGRQKLAIDEIDRELVKSMAGMLDDKGIAESTKKAYLRPISVLYNKAVKRGIVEDVKPFGETNLTPVIKMIRNNKKMRRIIVPCEMGEILYSLGELYLTNEEVKRHCKELEQKMHAERIKSMVSVITKMTLEDKAIERDIIEMIERKKRRDRRKKVS